MFKNYLYIAWRRLTKNRLYTTLNVLGLGSGIAAAILISLWLVDELSANRYHNDYERIALIHKNRHYNGAVFTEVSNPIPLGQELRNQFPDDLEEVVVSSYGGQRSLRIGEKTLLRRGLFMQEGGIDILGLQLTQGVIKRQLPPNTLYISESVGKALFGDESAIGKVVRMDENVNLEIVGVYKNLPKNSTYRAISFYGSFETYAHMEGWVQDSKTDWDNNSFPIYVKLGANSNMEQVSAKIEKTLYKATEDLTKPNLFLHPMAKWHLFTEFKNGKAVGSGLRNIWLFGTIGLLIVLLASINFMNLSTARSIKRSKEVGVRKVIGSRRGQLIKQFFVETYLTVGIALLIGFVLAVIFLPGFNDMANDQLEIPWKSPIFIGAMLLFALLVGLLAGSYPAFYLSSFNPVSVLKGLQKNGTNEALFRKGLVVLQFSISVALITGTVLIYQQIDFAKNRPMGYEQNNLIYFQKRSTELRGHFWAMREDLLASGGIVEMAESSGPVTEMWTMGTGFQWQGKEADSNEDFITLQVTPEFGETVEWDITKGRDFSRNFEADNETIILNESALEYMGFEDPIDQVIRWEGIDYKVIGVCKNLVLESPFEKVRPTIFTMKKANLPFVTMRMNPSLTVAESRSRVIKALQGFSPQGSFNIRFVDEEFGQKLWREKQVAQLATSLAVMAVFISFLGIYGLSSFMAEQRNKEIGIRKVLGASVPTILRLMVTDFIAPTAIGCLLAFPAAYFYMNEWLATYEFKIEISLMVFIVVGSGTVVLTLITAGVRSIRAANMNPAKSLRTE